MTKSTLNTTTLPSGRTAVRRTYGPALRPLNTTSRPRRTAR